MEAKKFKEKQFRSFLRKHSLQTSLFGIVLIQRIIHRNIHHGIRYRYCSRCAGRYFKHAIKFSEPSVSLLQLQRLSITTSHGKKSSSALLGAIGMDAVQASNAEFFVTPNDRVSLEEAG